MKGWAIKDLHYSGYLEFALAIWTVSNITSSVYTLRGAQCAFFEENTPEKKWMERRMLEPLEKLGKIINYSGLRNAVSNYFPTVS